MLDREDEPSGLDFLRVLVFPEADSADDDEDSL